MSRRDIFGGRLSKRRARAMGIVYWLLCLIPSAYLLVTYTLPVHFMIREGRWPIPMADDPKQFGYLVIHHSLFWCTLLIAGLSFYIMLPVALFVGIQFWRRFRWASMVPGLYAGVLVYWLSYALARILGQTDPGSVLYWLFD